MPNTVPAGTGSRGDDPLVHPEDSLSYTAPQTTVTYERNPQPAEETGYVAGERKKRIQKRLRLLVFVVLAILALGGGIWAFMQRGDGTNQIQIDTFENVHIPLAGILDAGTSGSAQSLKVNGQLDVSDSIVLTPSAQPGNPVIGQLYFDQTTNRLTYYDGQQFLELQAGAAGTTQITSNTTNIFGGNTIGAGGIDLNGTAGSLAMFTGANSLGDSRIRQSGSTLTIGSPTSDNIIQLGTSTGTQTVGIGSPSGASTTTIQGGTGGLSLSTGANPGVSGSISITTGNSTTTASGNITIDAGEGIVDGELISDKTFEGGTDNMGAWFGSTVAQSSAQAHTGSYSLEMTATDAFWGVEQLVLSATPVIPGHQYYFSFWVRAGSTPRTINGVLVWASSGGQQVSFTPTIDSASGWTQVTVTAPAPATATGAFFRFSSSGAAIDETHYFDDITIVDLSSSSAISAISIGATNAKIVTIGNMNQIGATSIYGSSGIALNSGAAGTTINGGVVNINGNAASSLSTTTGSLTLTSADSAVWGVGTAVSGVGGDLTLRAGRGGTDSNNNGGDLVLQGGAPNGTGTAGGVIVRPQTDATDAFQVQNSASVPLFTVDSATMNIVAGGTDTAYARLTLQNAHFTSTQTTPPVINTPTSCGTAPSAGMTAGSTDSAGSFTVTTGTGGTAATCDSTITFHQPYGAAPKSILVAGKTDAASAQRQPFVSASTANGFTVSFGASAGGADNTAYSFSYWVIE